jgi:trans-aconitate methyltransferase
MADWSEDISELYRKLAAIAVPARVEQIATLLTLIPFTAADRFAVVELASGEGYLAAAILEAFPKAIVLALDYEKSMQEATAKRLETYQGRWIVEAFDIQQDAWFRKMREADLVISSLCIHHLDTENKKRLFKAVQAHLTERGAFLIADLIMPKTEQARELFAATWDSMAEIASIEQSLARETFALFVQEQWNYYRYPDNFDKPSPIFEQLICLKEAGFPLVDCFWMQAGHAIYGGYQQAQSGGLSFENSLQIAQKILKT